MRAGRVPALLVLPGGCGEQSGPNDETKRCQAGELREKSAEAERGTAIFRSGEHGRASFRDLAGLWVSSQQQKWVNVRTGLPGAGSAAKWFSGNNNLECGQSSPLLDSLDRE